MYTAQPHCSRLRFRTSLALVIAAPPDRRYSHPTPARDTFNNTLPLNEVALDVLQRRQADHSTHVFTYEGSPIVQVNTKAWRNALVRAESHDFRWHDLRHTFATWHREAGTPTHELQRLGGWKTQSMVERYAHVAPEGLQVAAARLDNVLRTANCSSPRQVGAL